MLQCRPESTVVISVEPVPPFVASSTHSVASQEIDVPVAICAGSGIRHDVPAFVVRSTSTFSLTFVLTSAQQIESDVQLNERTVLVKPCVERALHRSPPSVETRNSPPDELPPPALQYLMVTHDRVVTMPSCAGTDDGDHVTPSLVERSTDPPFTLVARQMREEGHTTSLIPAQIEARASACHVSPPSRVRYAAAPCV